MILFKVTGIDLLIAVFQEEKACSKNRIIPSKGREEKTQG